jgi:uncharacterized Tic20 family protein
MGLRDGIKINAKGRKNKFLISFTYCFWFIMAIIRKIGVNEPLLVWLISKFKSDSLKNKNQINGASLQQNTAMDETT